jgi:hypothetical protein
VLQLLRARADATVLMADPEQVVGQPVQYQIPLLNVPAVFGTTLDTIPFAEGYLEVPKAVVEPWAGYLQPHGCLHVGIVWAGNPAHINDRYRSTQIMDWAPLLQLPGVAWYSLQKGQAEDELALAPWGAHVTPMGPRFTSMVDTAAMIHHLDLVITVDTSVAHLAAALGKPVWVLLPYFCDWRWSPSREDTPWYRSMRLFRQTTQGRWQEPMQAVRTALWQAVQRAASDTGAQRQLQAWSAAAGGNWAPWRNLSSASSAELESLSPVDGQVAPSVVPAAALQDRGFVDLALQALLQQAQYGSLEDLLAHAPECPEPLKLMVLCAWIEHEHAAGRFRAALTLCERGLQQWSASPPLLVWQARLLVALREFAEAQPLAEMLAGRFPRLPRVWLTLGQCAHHQGQYDKAINYWQRAVWHDYQLAEAWRGLAAVMLDRKILWLAAGCLRLAEQQVPCWRLAWLKSRLAVLEVRFADAQAHFASARALAHAADPLPADVRWYGVWLDFVSGEDAAWYAGLQQMRQLAQTPADRSWALLQEAIYWLGRGDYQQGWQYALESYQGLPLSHYIFHPQTPFWQGEPLNTPEKLLVFAEQGFGDTLQLVRFMAMIHVPIAALICQDKLVGLLRTNFPHLTILGITEAKASPVPHAVCLSLHQIAPLLQLQPHQFGSAPSYLQPAADTFAHWQGFWAGAVAGSGPRVGLVWRGNPHHANDWFRSMSLPDIEPLLAVPHVAWYGLSVGQDDIRVTQLYQRYGVHDLAPHLGDFSDTAAAIAGLDLVIAVDTAVAHLAGAMGKPVWLLLPKYGDWRWGQEGEATPWYPTMRLFRQHAMGDWHPVVRAVADSLTGWQGYAHVPVGFA